MLISGGSRGAMQFPIDALMLCNAALLSVDR
jgi:hypothetical protein